MKIKTASVLLLTPIIFYLVGAFYSISFNIADWSQETRLIISMLTLGTIGVYLFVKYLEDIN